MLFSEPPQLPHTLSLVAPSCSSCEVCCKCIHSSSRLCCPSIHVTCCLCIARMSSTSSADEGPAAAGLASCSLSSLYQCCNKLLFLPGGDTDVLQSSRSLQPSQVFLSSHVEGYPAVPVGVLLIPPLPPKCHKLSDLERFMFFTAQNENSLKTSPSCLAQQLVHKITALSN